MPGAFQSDYRDTGAGAKLHRGGGSYGSEIASLLWRVSDMLLLVPILLVTSIGSITDVHSLMAAEVNIGTGFTILASALSATLVFDIAGLYDAHRWRPDFQGLGRAFLAAAAASLLSIGLLWVSPWVAHLPGFVKLTLATAIMLLSLRIPAQLLRMPRSVSRPVATLIVGSGRRALAAYQQLGRPTGLRTFVGVVDADDFPPQRELADQVIGNLEDLRDILMHTVVDEVITALPIKSKYRDVERVIRICEEAGVRVSHPTDIFEGAPAEERAATGASMLVLRGARDQRMLQFKRVMDVVISAIGLVLLLPLMFAIAILIAATSPGNPFFVQERYGLGKRRFRLYKFRTMVPAADAMHDELSAMNEKDGPIFKIENDPRVTPFGRLLRKSSLDELPQLWNVLIGDMSLVGPRPMSVRDVQKFSRPSYMRRFSVQPGITCLWQVSGRSDLSFDQWLALDLAYISRQSIRLDMIIMARTIPAILSGRGAM